MNDRVTVSIELTQGQWDAVCVLVRRRGRSPVGWIEEAVSERIAIAMELLPERIPLEPVGSECGV